MDQDDQRQHDFATRLLDAAERAERHIGPHRVLLALLGAGLSYSMRHSPSGDIAELLRQAAGRIETAEQPRSVN